MNTLWNAFCFISFIIWCIILFFVGGIYGWMVVLKIVGFLAIFAAIVGFICLIPTIFGMIIGLIVYGTPALIRKITKK